MGEEPFGLTGAQKQRLLTLRATWEEGEGEEALERLRQREEDAETVRAVADLLRETRFREGGDLTHAQMARLLALVRALAPNPNLDARLLRQPDEPAALNHDLRDLFYGEAAMPVHLTTFLTRRHAGAQTTLQWLCAVFPEDWPLVTRAGLRTLELTPNQVETARREARRQFIAASGANSEAAPLEPDTQMVRLLAEVEIYRAVREVLEARDFLEVHRLLTMQGRARSRRSRRALSSLLYTPLSPAAIVREDDAPPYRARREEEAEPPVEADFEAVAPDISDISMEAILRYLEQFIAAQGFTYPPLTVRDFFLSLQTRPFALLSGLSGTGKTRLTSLFAEALTGAVATQYRLLPVRPDWADSTPLLGYVNLLASGGEGRFVSTPFLDFLRRAARPENAFRAFFLCLDEMNLARVEHYLAEVLSAMETPTRELLLPDGRTLRLPANLFLLGTLNLDEATYALSRKVLDRANALTFQEVCLRDEEESGETTALYTPEIRQAAFLLTRITTPKEARARLRQMETGGVDFAAQVIQTLSEANALLEPHGLHFAYRIRDDILCYCAQSFDADGNGLLTPDAPDDQPANLRIALDLQLLHRVLPRLSGTAEQVEVPAQELLRWAQSSHFSRTARRLTRFLSRLQRSGFASMEAV